MEFLREDDRKRAKSFKVLFYFNFPFDSNRFPSTQEKQMRSSKINLKFGRSVQGRISNCKASQEQLMFYNIRSFGWSKF